MAFKTRMFYPQQEEEEEEAPPFRPEAVMPEPRKLGLFDGGGAQDLFRKSIAESAPALSSASDPSTNGPLTFKRLVESGSSEGKTTHAKLWGGDQVSSAETEMDTARKELGSFGDSAGKWWSVLLAAMFPQYGQALNMMEGFKRNKYMAARDKYNTAMEAAMKEDQLRMRYEQPRVHDLGGGYKMAGGQLLHPERKQYETIMAMGPDGPVTKFIEKLPGADTTIDVPSFETIYGFGSGDTVKAQGLPVTAFNAKLRGGDAMERAQFSADARAREVEARAENQRELESRKQEYRKALIDYTQQTRPDISPATVVMAENNLMRKNPDYQTLSLPEQRRLLDLEIDSIRAMSQGTKGAPTQGRPGNPKVQ